MAYHDRPCHALLPCSTLDAIHESMLIFSLYRSLCTEYLAVYLYRLGDCRVYPSSPSPCPLTPPSGISSKTSDWSIRQSASYIIVFSFSCPSPSPSSSSSLHLTEGKMHSLMDGMADADAAAADADGSGERGTVRQKKEKKERKAIA
ncbi:hypothetical protein MGYG_04433 [Nannizzia gypsea CBS 118893]|uniref:Uncharacterized protein n=1 Tax=Arthroderma gypseum (strain ATCC MYA-4604 / CBS 118893) TaxID=535722 RepID=E4USX7_ARTGP|nr:hypothetical protein MGYG_04433 [Nannizzia gypsea CBS 118893]EFR01426.1 hypothetical protein MGYG_04433 [Nannizzia gypsea CBS 118893]